MKRIRHPALGFILCLHAFAQAPICAVSGTVTEPNGKPVAKARVFATGSAYSLWKVTDASGFFCFEQLEPDSYRVSVENAGYLPGKRRLVAVEKDSKPVSLKFEISRSAVISGVVLDSDGEPLPGASVALWTRARTAKGFIPNSEETLDAGPGGAFRFDTLDPGSYYLSVTPRGQDQSGRRYNVPFLDTRGKAAREIEMETFYSGSLTFAGAAPLTIKAGQQITNLTLTVRRSAARHLAGQISTPSSKDFLILDITTETSSGNAGTISVRPDGTFDRSGLVPAIYTLRLMNEGKTVARQRVDLTTGDAEGVLLAPIETSDVVMKFRTEHDGPALRLPPFAMLVAREGSDTSVTGHPQADGTIRFKDVVPDIYSLLIPLGDQRLYVKQPVGHLDLREGKVGVVEVVLSPDVARVEGRVNDASEETTLILVSEMASIVKQTTAEGSGKFKLEAVRPGKYRLFAIQGFDEDEWGRAELADALAAKSLKLELKENDNRSVALTVISGEEWDAAVAKLEK
jgi:hypothetical protein